jgi:hypothetical protein
MNELVIEIEGRGNKEVMCWCSGKSSSQIFGERHVQTYTLTVWFSLNYSLCTIYCFFLLFFTIKMSCVMLCM